jgi:hypothetical protein
MLANAASNIDSNGRVTNEKTRQLVRQLLEALAALVNQLHCKP